MIQTAAFPVTLLFPPQGHFTQPYLALPCIKAYLQAHGFGDVELVDASIEAYDAFLSRPSLEAAAERAGRRLPLERYLNAEHLPFGELEGFRAAAETAVSARALIERVEDAKRVARGDGFFEPERYIPAMRTLYHGLRLASAAWFPSRLTPHNFTMAYANDRSAELLAATLDGDQNPFIEHFRAELLPRLVARAPRVLGLSVIYGSQLIPALTLARMVKRSIPGCHVTAGGGFLAYIGKKLMQASGVSECLDSLVFHEGEAPLLALCQALCAGEELSGVGSLAWFDRTGREPRAVFNAPAHPIPLDQAPVPDFDGLPFELYFTPEIVIPFDVNRGCYYGECTFCTLPTVIGPGYRTRRAETIVDAVLALAERHRTRNFNFITDCMPPGMIRDLPEELIRRGADIRWWADARVEPKAYTPEGARQLHESGCRKLLFGFETATPRLLKLMKKGQSLERTLEVARNCTEAGISVTFYAMVGFPTETRAEARATLEFLRRNSDVVREISLQTFHIDEVAQIYNDPEPFGIRILSDPAADLQLYHDYEAEQGMTQEEAAEMFCELMAGFAEFLPIFSGDNVLYFQQKSHYFLHLARGTTPAEFAASCAQRSQRRTEQGPDPRLRAGAELDFVDLPFRYNEALSVLASPLARAVRPDFLTGRYVADAERAAQERIAPLARHAAVLAYDGESAEFCELRPDGRRALEALRAAGSLGDLVEALDPALPGADAAKASLERFAVALARAGLLHSGPPCDRQGAAGADARRTSDAHA